MDNPYDSLKKLVSIDIETTGLYPSQGARMIEIGIATVVGGNFAKIEAFTPLDTVYSEEALRVNGHTEDELRSRIMSNREPDGFVSQHEAVDLVNQFCIEHGVSILVGKNPQFDMRFLKYFSRPPGSTESEKEKSLVLSRRVIDWGAVATGIMIANGELIPDEGFSSSDVLRFLGVPDEPKPHDGLVGAVYNTVAFHRVMEIIQK
jgi:DNA polymerase III epsilon subunit-like protein